MRVMTNAKYSAVYLKVNEQYFPQSFDFKMCAQHLISGAPQIRSWQMIWRSSLHHVHKFTDGFYHEIGKQGACTVADQFASSHNGF